MKFAPWIGVGFLALSVAACGSQEGGPTPSFSVTGSSPPTNTQNPIRLASPTETQASTDRSSRRAIGWEQTRRVMEMDWPADIAPMEPVKRRIVNVSAGADRAFRMDLEQLSPADEWGHDINPEVVEKISSVTNSKQLLSALDYARDRILDDRLSTSFLGFYARLLQQAGNDDTATYAVVAFDFISIIDTARCDLPEREQASGVVARRQQTADLRETARKILRAASLEKRRAIAEAVLATERRSAPIRRDEALCRMNRRYEDMNAPLQRVPCAHELLGQKSAFSMDCVARADDKGIPTRWADEEAWRKRRIDVLTGLTPEVIAENWGKNRQ